MKRFALCSLLLGLGMLVGCEPPKKAAPPVKEAPAEDGKMTDDKMSDDKMEDGKMDAKPGDAVEEPADTK